MRVYADRRELWVGVVWDDDTVYVSLFPGVVIVIRRRRRR